jgi:hypothetical protein
VSFSVIPFVERHHPFATFFLLHAGHKSYDAMGTASCFRCEVRDGTSDARPIRCYTVMRLHTEVVFNFHEGSCIQRPLAVPSRTVGNRRRSSHVVVSRSAAP